VFRCDSILAFASPFLKRFAGHHFARWVTRSSPRSRSGALGMVSTHYTREGLCSSRRGREDNDPSRCPSTVTIGSRSSRCDSARYARSYSLDPNHLALRGQMPETLDSGSTWSDRERSPNRRKMLAD
jgi:hypothetical protein